MMESGQARQITQKETRWLDALKRVATALDAEEISYFLDTGTLLGAVRDGAFIPWDNDIDIGTLDCPYDDTRLVAAIRSLVVNGFVANLSVTGVGLFSPNAVEVNLKFYDMDGDHFVADYSHSFHPSALLNFLYNVSTGDHVASFGNHVSYRAKSLLIATRTWWRSALLRLLSSRVTHKLLVARVRVSSLVPLGTVPFYDSEFSAPHNFREYLADRYGPSWEVPVRNYDYTRDDRSIAGSSS